MAMIQGSSLRNVIAFIVKSNCRSVAITVPGHRVHSLPKVLTSCHQQFNQQQHYSVAVSSEQPTLWKRMKSKLWFSSDLQVPKYVLKYAGHNMYLCCTQLVDYDEIFKTLDLPDTFNSWFLITDLHVWLCLVKLAEMGPEGRLLKRSLVTALWADVTARTKLLGERISSNKRNTGIQSLADLFYASLFAYDEGLLADDKVLAGAIWRTLFEMRKDMDAEKLALMVGYVRKQVQHLDEQDVQVIMAKGLITFLPLFGDKEEKDKNMWKLKLIYKHP